MKTWSTPSLSTLEINNTSDNTKQPCQYDSTKSCFNNGNGLGRCNNCDLNPNKNTDDSTNSTS